MTVRILFTAVALALLITTGCKTSSRYQPSCAPAVVATTRVQPACPPGQMPPPPPFVPAPR